MLDQSLSKAPVDMKVYQQLIEGMGNKIGAQPRKTILAGAA